MAVVSVQGTATSSLTAQVTARLRTGFSIKHLQVALKCAREAYRIQSEHLGAPFGPWFDGVLEVVPVAIVMSAAALEANANEIIDDILEGLEKVTISDSQKELLNQLNDDKTGNFRAKFRTIALILGKVPNLGISTWEDAKLLITFRNHFMHFRPAWGDDDIHSKGFVEQMKMKVGVVDAYKNYFIFPYGLMTCECAKWAVSTALGLSTEFSKQAGVVDRFALPHLNTNLP